MSGENVKSRKILNIAGYQFHPLAPDKLKYLREYLTKWGNRHMLKGTILISKEGANLFLAGDPDHISGFMDKFRSISGLADFKYKESWSEDQPFTRFLVRIKKEIIAFGVDAINPIERTSPYIAPEKLKSLLDAGEDVVLLDTRNDYEVKVGTFEGATPIGVQNFTQFPDAVSRLDESLKEKTVVTFCTGGIRCEKAAPLLESRGFKKVFQLEGGILKYFEECGGAHYSGDCFVFDHRVALGPDLKETEVRQCYACRAVLLPEDYKSEHYVPGQSCPNCHDADLTKIHAQLELRNRQLREATRILPGSIPYENARPLKVPASWHGKNILEFLYSLKFRPPEQSWEDILSSGRMTINNEKVGVDCTLSTGNQIVHHIPGTVEPPVASDIRVVYEDEALIILNKPAPLPVHPSGRFNRNTLLYIVRESFSPVVPRFAHRLDANTSGIIALTKSKEFASTLQPEFERGFVDKEYRARIHGHPEENHFTCNLSISRESTTAGGRSIDPDGLTAETGFWVEKLLDDGTSLIRVRLMSSGRTHQIRIHLWALGFPIVGDPLYLRDNKRGGFQTLDPESKPMCLQSAALGFAHPQHGHRVRFEADEPDWWQSPY